VAEELNHGGPALGLAPVQAPRSAIVAAAAVAGTVVGEGAGLLGDTPLHRHPHGRAGTDASFEHDQRVAAAGDHAPQRPAIGQAQLLFSQLHSSPHELLWSVLVEVHVSMVEVHRARDKGSRVRTPWDHPGPHLSDR